MVCWCVLVCVDVNRIDCEGEGARGGGVVVESELQGCRAEDCSGVADYDRRLCSVALWPALNPSSPQVPQT